MPAGVRKKAEQRLKNLSGGDQSNLGPRTKELIKVVGSSAAVSRRRRMASAGRARGMARRNVRQRIPG